MLGLTSVSLKEIEIVDKYFSSYKCVEIIHRK